MVKLTIIGRVRDGVPLAQGLRYVSEDNNNLTFYKKQAEVVLKEISRGTLAPNSRMTIRLDHQHSFKTLAFHYLQDLRQELEKYENDGVTEKIATPYSFFKFDSVISSIRKQYIDTRTQANLKKLNSNRGHELDIVIENMSTIIENRRQIDYFEKVVMAPQVVSPIWGSRHLEIIALKWMPIGIATSVLVTVLLWASLSSS